MALVTTKYRITQTDPNVVLRAGVAHIEREIATFTVPDRTIFEIAPDDIFSLFIADTTPTELALTSRVVLVVADPNDIFTRELATLDYTVVREFADRLRIYTFGQAATIKPKDRIRIRVTGNLAVAPAHTRFQISTTRVSEI